MIIGFNGASGSGKDTAAQTLIYGYGFRRLAFADNLKLAVKASHGLTDAQLWGELKDVIDSYWGKTPAEICQDVGMKYRELDEDFWIKSLFRMVEPHEHYVITDVRFPNEAKAIQGWAGKLYRTIRPGHVPARRQHVSETALDDWGWNPVNTIMNDGTPTDLARRVVATCVKPVLI